MPRERPPTQGATPRYAFEEAEGEVAEALRTVLASYRLTAVERAATRERTAEAEALLRRRPAVTAKLLVADLRRLSPYNVHGHATLLTLLGEAAGEEEVLGVIAERLMLDDLPAFLSEQDSPIPAPEVLVRGLIMSWLQRSASAGSAPARQALLQALSSPYRDVVAAAVRSLYALTPSRLGAQAEMRPLLAAEDRHLLYLF